MAQTIKLKRSAVAGRIPNVSDLELGEIAINTYDGKMYIKKSVNGEESISEIGQGSGLGSVFTSYTFTATANQTVFTGNDNSGSALDIVDEFSNVFMNGILLDPEIDFTVSSDGLTLTLTEPAEADDILQINSFDQAIFNGTLNVDALALTGMAGEMVWNSDEETIDVPLNDDVTLQLGQEFVFRGKATEAIANGDVVMFAGAQGGHLLIAKADMSSVGFAPEYVIGIATQDFNTNDFGFVTELGKVRGLDTSGYSEGDILYLDPTTAGALTATKPTPPNHSIQMCAVVNSHITQGTLLVRPTHMVDTDEVAEGSSNLYFTVARAVAAIKADGDWNASDWDTAFGWGDHATEGYLTSVAFNDLTSTPTTISGYGITDAFDGAYSSLTGKPTLFSGSYTDLTNKPTIPTVPTTVSSFTNDSGYITDYTVTQGDVTAHQAALSITESQISDLGSYLTSETNTTLQIVGNTLRYTDETGTNTDIDLSLYLDDTNLSRLTSGSLDASGTATFTRDDSSTFTVDFSQFFDDTNLARITSAAFNTANGVLTLTRDDATTITTDLDGRYLTGTKVGFQVTSTQYAPAAIAYIPGNKAYFDVLVEFSNGVFFDIKASTDDGVITTRHNYVDSGADPEIDAIFTTYNETEDRTYLGIYYASTGTYDISFTKNSINTDLVLFSAYTSGFEGSTYGTNSAKPLNNFFKGLTDKAADAELLDGYNSSDFALVDKVYKKTLLNSISDWDNMPLGFGSNAQTGRPNQPTANHSITLTVENENSAGRKAQLFFGDTPDSMYFRPRQGDTVGWHPWEKLWTTASFSSTDISNWDTAYGWGNHASAGYLTSLPSHTHDYLPLAGGTLTGNLTLNSATPEILFNGTSDAGVDMAIKATPEGLDFYEPEDVNKIHFQILDDTGVNAPFGYNVGTTQVIDSSGNVKKSPTLTLSGDVSGTATFTDLGNATLTATVANDSHTHDGRYYTESEVNTFINRSFVSGHSENNLAVGWYTIATNSGSRASARFGIWDTNSSDHQSVTFYASHHFGTDGSNTLTVLDNSYYSGNPFRYIRIKDYGTYDGAALQVYIDDATNSVNTAILGDNFQASGWVLCDWIPDATTPPNVSNYGNFGERSKVDLNTIAQGGFATTGEIFAGGDTSQYQVFHNNYHPNADKWTTARTLSLTGDVTGSVSIDGSANASITATVANDSHSHSNYLPNSGAVTHSGLVSFSGTGSTSGLRFNSTVVANDAFGIRANGTSNAGELEFYSTDDDNEPFVFRHYTTGQDGTGPSVEWARISNLGLGIRGTTVIDSSRNIKNVNAIHQQEVHYPNVTYSSSGNTTGRIKIALPDTSSDYDMMTIELTVYEYNSESGTKIYLSGHNWTSGWYNTRATVIGGYSSPIYLARSTADGKHYIVLGDTDTSWNYVTVHVDKVTTAGFYSVQDWTLGWTVTKVTTENTTYSQISSNMNQIASNTLQTRGHLYSNGLNIGGQTFADSSRNLTNINSLTSSGTLTGADLVISNKGYFGSDDDSIRVGGAGGGKSGVFGNRMTRDGSNLSYGAYLSYDAFWNGSAWQANRTTLTRKWMTHIGGYHDDNFHINRYGNSASGTWADGDWTRLLTLDSGGLLNTLSGYQVNGTTVIDSNSNLTNIGSISASSTISGATRLYVSGLDTGNPTTASNTARMSGYGLLGNRGTFYLTNAGGDVQIGNGSSHAQNPTCSFSASAVSLAPNRNLQMNGTTVIDSSRNLTNIANITATGLLSVNKIYTAISLPNGGAICRGGTTTATSDLGLYSYVSGNWIRIVTNNAPINFFSDGGTNGRGTIINVSFDTSGNITARGNVTAYSDARLKDNVKTLDGSKVYEMRGVSFTKDGELGSGVIAQELEQVAPELVMTNDDEMQTKSVAYGNVVGYLIEAIKELKSEIEELKNGNNTN